MNATRVEVTPELLADLEAKARAAAKGPWRISASPSNRFLGSVLAANSYVVAEVRSGHVRSDSAARDANASFIVAAHPPTVFALIERIRELESPCETEESRHNRLWWASLTFDQRRACLVRRDNKSCPCGDGTGAGHPYCWCMPHPNWLPR